MRGDVGAVLEGNSISPTSKAVLEPRCLAERARIEGPSNDNEKAYSDNNYAEA